MHRSLRVLLVIVFGAAHTALCSEAYLPAERVDVLPVFFVPGDGPSPTRVQADKLMRHVKWAQSRYREMLGGRATCSEPPCFLG